jgi:hypothetical protein
MRYRELFTFIKKRYSIYLKKERGELRPWTKDPILQSYRFTNVHREYDTVTRWIFDKWIAEHDDDPHLWFALMVARHVNLPAALEELGYPVPWHPVHFVEVMEARRARGERAFNGAYMINAQGCEKGGSKAQYLAEQVFTPMWLARRHTEDLLQRATCAEFCDGLQGFRGIKGFMAGQVVADLKYAAPLRDAPDWWTFAVSGPGSRRGLNWVFGREIKAPWRENEWHAALMRLKVKIDPLVERAGIPPLHAQDLQNCLCEISKYVRGYSRRKYDGKGDS